MKQVRTAKGRMIDMAALAKKNEDARAVSPGNVTLNARGDRVDNSGNVVQTVQSKARVQHETTSAPEKRRLSDAPTAPKKAPVKKPKPATDGESNDGPMVIREEEKIRDDGSSYIEIEYDDGSMEVKEL